MRDAHLLAAGYRRDVLAEARERATGSVRMHPLLRGMPLVGFDAHVVCASVRRES